MSYMVLYRNYDAQRLVFLNIAEGSGRRTIRDYIRFLYQARGSLYELEYLVHISHRLGYITDEAFRLLRSSLRQTAGTLLGFIRFKEQEAQEREEFLSQRSVLAPYSPKIYRLNPKWVKSFKEIDSPQDKTDPIDAISIAERIRFRQPKHPFNANMAEKLQQVARESYRIRPSLAESVNIVLTTTLNNIRALKVSLKEVNAAIQRAYKGFSLTLDTIPGIGAIFAAGIFAEIGDIKRFTSEAVLARYAGLAWKKSQSGDFEADETPIFRSSNIHLRYYLIEAANSVKNNEPEYKEYYQKKYSEVRKHQHKRALVLTARKLVRLIYALLIRGEIYQKAK